MFVLARNEALVDQLHSAGWANVSFERIKRGLVPFPDTVFVGVAVDMVELEVVHGAPPVLQENSRSGQAFSFAIHDPNFDPPAWWQHKVDRFHSRLNVDLSHLQSSLIGKHNDAAMHLLAARQLIASKLVRLRFPNLVEELGSDGRFFDWVALRIAYNPGQSESLRQCDASRRRVAGCRFELISRKAFSERFILRVGD